MKKSKLLIPLITLAGTGAVIAPVMCLTSCSKNEVEEQHFILSSGDKNITPKETAGSIKYVFVTNDTLTEEQAKLVEFIAVCKTVPSGMSLSRCFINEISSDRTQFTIQIDYSINPSCFTDEGTKLEYDIKLHNGTWYQLETGFSITAKK